MGGIDKVRTRAESTGAMSLYAPAVRGRRRFSELFLSVLREVFVHLHVAVVG